MSSDDNQSLSCCFLPRSRFLLCVVCVCVCRHWHPHRSRCSFFFLHTLRQHDNTLCTHPLFGVRLCFHTLLGFCKWVFFFFFFFFCLYAAFCTTGGYNTVSVLTTIVRVTNGDGRDVPSFLKKKRKKNPTDCSVQVFNTKVAMISPLNHSSVPIRRS